MWDADRTEAEEARARARKSLGPHWRRRLDNALGTLIDAEGVLKTLRRGNFDSSLSDVCDALREVTREG